MELADLQARLRSARTWWALMRQLVTAWRDRPNPNENPWEGPDEVFEALGELICFVEDAIGLPDTAGPSAEHVDMICRAIEGDGSWRIAAVADAVDRCCHPIFSTDWMTEHAAPYTPEPGALYPVPAWNGPEGWEYSRRPDNFTLRPDEFPHVRAYEPTVGFTKPIRTVFDSSSDVELAAALAGLDTLATIHPNRRWSELTMSAGSSAFPVVPSNVRQLDLIKAGVAAALHAGAGVIVVPELAISEALATDLRAWLVEQGAFAVVVAGSYHTVADGEPANIAEVIVGATQPAQRIAHRKIVPFSSSSPGARPSREGIKAGPREIRVLVCGGYRFATVICKDFLDVDVRHALVRAGVNVVAVPAMNTKMHSYPAEVDGFVLATQGVAAIANNPGEHPNGNPLRPAFVFGQPKRTKTSVAGPASVAPFAAIFTLGAEEGRCISLD